MRFKLMATVLGLTTTLFNTTVVLNHLQKTQTLDPAPAISKRLMPRVTPEMLQFSVWHTAPLEVAKVYGRAPGCSEASPELIEMTATAAVEANVDPAIVAATVATESSCNQYAVSSRGAIGLMQIMPRIWKDRFDFAGSVNLLNRQDNLKAGALIMADNISHFGLRDGIQRYNGVGVGCDTCDGGYATRILSLAHK